MVWYNRLILLTMFILALSISKVDNSKAQKIAAIHQRVLFVDVTTEIGIRFRDVNGESGKKYFIEPLGRGIALLDYDNDGDLDIYLVNGCDLPNINSPLSSKNTLYRNDNGKYVDVTTAASVGDTGYGLGCCVGDYNNDGYIDIYVTNYGPNVLYENNNDENGF